MSKKTIKMIAHTTTTDTQFVELLKALGVNDKAANNALAETKAVTNMPKYNN